MPFDEIQPAIVGSTIKRLLQTPSRPVGIVIKEFGDRYWMELVAELDDGRLIQINECDYSHFAGDPKALSRAELTQREYSLADVEGHMIVAIHDSNEEFALALSNGLCVTCPGGPGGNTPWIYPMDR